MIVEGEKDTEEYIFRKENHICVVCGSKEMYDDFNEEWYCSKTGRS